MIVVVDYGLGNLGSIVNMLKKIGAQSIISSASKDIEAADKLILSGVGSFDTGMQNIYELGLKKMLEQKVRHEKIPILGICLGMQLLTQKSEEGRCAGLGWINAETRKFNFTGSNVELRVPHMGWNTVTKKKDHVLARQLGEEPRFYFVHSYHVVCNDRTDILLETRYGCNFTSALQRDNIYGVQFHPEKSHKFGMQLLKNFCTL